MKSSGRVTRGCLSLQVPELHVLRDDSRMRAAQELRHQVALQYRMSRMNEDRLRVLLHNNPPPDLNNWAGGVSSPARYVLPPSTLPPASSVRCTLR